MLFLVFVVVCSCGIYSVDSRSIPDNAFHSDVIVTHWPTEKTKIDVNIASSNEEDEPGWMRKQLLKFGKVASKVGNAMGSHATKITAAIDRICEVVKTILPFLAAVCHVGQFQFCQAAEQGPDQVAQAVNPSGSLDLDRLDK